MSACDRNDRIITTLMSIVNEIRAGRPMSQPLLPPHIQASIGQVCAADVKGYREVLLTVLVAWTDGVVFDPCDGDFYACNPRGLFEQGIRPALLQSGLKSRKSGPLNVAKAQRKLDESWANSRQDTTTAALVVALMRWSAEDIPGRTALVLSSLVVELIEEASHFTTLAVSPPTAISAPEASTLMEALIDEAPNAGNTAQVVVHAALVAIHHQDGASVGDVGRASETNLTSKKPADLSVLAPWMTTPHLYEVTTKTIDRNRLEDSDDSIIEFGGGARSVTWLCLIPNNISTITPVCGCLISARGIRHEFVDLREWIRTVMELLGEHRRDAFIVQITRYIDDAQTDHDVKIAWKRIRSIYLKH